MQALTTVTTVTSQKFKTGDRVCQNLNDPKTPIADHEKILIHRGTVLDYRPMPGVREVFEPYILWDNGQEGFAAEITLSMEDSTESESIVWSPGLTRLNKLEEEIKSCKLQMHRAVAEIYEDRLWEEAGYNNFEDYCFRVWGWQKSNGYAMASAGAAITGLLDSGVPENQIPDSTSAINEVAKAGSPAQQASVLQETQEREGSVTVAGVKRTLRHTPSIELMAALWSQVGDTERPAIASHPERLIVSGPLFSEPLEFDTTKEAQQAWEMEGQKLCAQALNTYEPNAEAKQSLVDVPCTITSSGREGEAGQHALLMGGWPEGIKDTWGNTNTPWDYPVLVNGSALLRALHLFQVKICWEGTSTWQPSARSSIPTALRKPATTEPLSAVTYAPDDSRGQIKQAMAQGLPTLAPLSSSTDQYSLIVADPPWQYSLRETDASHRGRTPYPNMGEDEILTLPVGSVGAEDSYILLWATNNHLPLAFDCLTVWGYEYKAIHTWAKLSEATGNPQIGLGHYGRNCTEHFLVGRKGNPPSWTTLGIADIPTLLRAPKNQRHSRKPEEFWAIANRLKVKLGGQAIELFATESREGWDSWGFEAKPSVLSPTNQV